MEITNKLVKKVRKWLGKERTEFFEWCIERYGSVNTVFPEDEYRKIETNIGTGWLKGSVPHIVHFREGMQVRNFMRSTGLCDDWSATDLDDNWVEVVEEALFSVKLNITEEKNAKKKAPYRK